MDLHAERQLVTRSRAGDRDAFGMLFQAHRDRAYRLACRLTSCHADADDVLQEAWLRAFSGMPAFDGRAQFGTWFFRILLRAAADHGRRRRRRPVESLATVEEPPSTVAGGDPAQQAAASELNDALRQALVRMRSAWLIDISWRFPYVGPASQARQYTA